MPPEGAPAPEAGLDLAHWQGDALVVGCGGIGMALLQALSQRAPGLRLWGTSRRECSPGRLMPPGRVLPLDLTDDTSLSACAKQLQAEDVRLRLVINTAGLLHDGGLRPEKRLQQLERVSLERLFSVNAYGPVLLARALEPLLPRQEPVHFASLSARVGSIGDNRLGAGTATGPPRRPRTSCCAAWPWNGNDGCPRPASPCCIRAPPPRPSPHLSAARCRRSDCSVRSGPPTT